MFKPNLKTIEKDYSSLRFLLFLLSIFSLLSIIMIHNFLYGYFFGGNGENFSNFYLVTNFINFSPLTISFVTFIFFGLYYFLTSLRKLILLINVERKAKKKIIEKHKTFSYIITNIKSILELLILFFIVITSITLILTFTFSQNSINTNDLLYFLTISFILLSLVSVIMLTLWKLICSLFIDVSIFFIALFYNISFLIIIDSTFIVKNIWVNLISYVLITPITLYMIKILSHLNNKKIMKLTLFYSIMLFNFSGMLFLFSMTNFKSNGKFLNGIMIFLDDLFFNVYLLSTTIVVFIVSTIIFTIIIKKSNKTSSRSEHNINLILNMINEQGILKVTWELLLDLFDKRNFNSSNQISINSQGSESSSGSIKSYEIKTFISLAILISFLLTSQAALDTGFYVRQTFIKQNEGQEINFCIKFIDQNKKVNYIKSNYYMNNGNEIIYSDANWNFSVLKNDNYQLKTMKSISHCEKSSKKK